MKKNIAQLLFEWPIKTAPRLALPLFIFLAVLLHLSTIYLFDIVYQQPHVSKPVAPQVLFLPPHSLPAQQLSAWMQANDPAIFSPLKTIQLNRPKIAPEIYQPVSQIPELQHLPESLKKEEILPLLPTQEIIPSSPPSLTSIENLPLPSASPISHVTTIRLLDHLKTRSPTPLSSLGYPLIPKEVTTPLSPTLLKINIDPSGFPRHCIIIQSSRNSIADEAATHWLMTRRFPPAPEETWGTLLILWGSN